jgi:hypothetical protein
MYCALALGLGLTACNDATKPPGQLVLSVETDMALPDQIDTIRVQVQVRGVSLHDVPYPVGAGDTPIPATLTLVEGTDATTAVTVRVAGSKLGKWRTFREAITMVPSDRTASLRMPVQWLCDGTARGVAPQDDSPLTMMGVESTCGEGNTCKAGKCVPSDLEPSVLTDYAAERVFGGAAKPNEGTCFDTIRCMVEGMMVVPDERCTIAKPAGDAVNVALRVTADGICDSSGTVCFVPLDGQSDEGWSTQGNRIALPQAACDKLAQHVVKAVVVSTDCETKTEAFPPCGEWSSVGNAKPIAPPDAGPSAPLPTASRIAALVPDGSKARPCCPLMSENGALYACVCNGNDQANLVEVKLASPDKSSVVGQLMPSAPRDGSEFAATMSEGTLYWADDRNLQRTPLPGSNPSSGPLAVDGSIYESASLLADANAIYALVSGGSAPHAPAVELLKVELTGAVTGFDTGATRPVVQFDQDDAAIYLATDVDNDIDSGKRIERTSSITRIGKGTGERSTVLSEQVIRLDKASANHGGYVGVQLDGASLFALFEEAPDDAGNIHLQVHSTRVSKRSISTDPKILYDSQIDPATSKVALIGAVDGSVVLYRVEYDASEPDAPRVRSASVIVVHESGEPPRIVADFARDYPMEGVATDADHIYWLNSSGTIYEFPRQALEDRNGATLAR